MANTTAEHLATVKTRLCLLSDSHGMRPAPAQFKNRAFRYPLPSADILIHAGDLTRLGTYEEHRSTADFLAKSDAELKIVIAGNHDITLDRSWFEKNGPATRHYHGADIQDLEEIRQLYCGKDAVEHGIRYLEEGVATFELKNGACFKIYASPWQPVHSNWAFTYDLDIDRFNGAPAASKGRPAFIAPNPVPSYPDIDIMVTHGPPYGICDLSIRKSFTGDQHVGCRHLRRAVDRCRPRLHVFGHIHEGYGAERMHWPTQRMTDMPTNPRKAVARGHEFLDISRSARDPLAVGHETLLVNACVVDKYYHPFNAPWVVEMELPCRVEAIGDHTMSVAGTNADLEKGPDEPSLSEPV